MTRWEWLEFCYGSQCTATAWCELTWGQDTVAERVQTLQTSGQALPERSLPSQSPYLGEERLVLRLWLLATGLFWWLPGWAIFHASISYVLLLQGKKKEKVLSLCPLPKGLGLCSKGQARAIGYLLGPGRDCE